MGKALNVPVGEYSSLVSLSAEEDTPVSKIVEMMEDMGIRHIPILKDKKPVGIISARDLQSAHASGEDPPAADIMVRHPFCVHNETDIGEVAFEMSSRKIGSALVLDENERLDGIFTTVDALNALVEIVRGDME